MKVKRLLALVLAGSMLTLSLAGCGGTKKAESSEGTETAGKQQEESKASGDKTVITMMYSGTPSNPDFETEILPGLVEKAFPDVKLEVTKLPDDQYYTALKTKLASGECPDIILVHPKYAGANGVINLAKAGYLEPLTDLKVMDLVGDGAKEAFSYDGEIYGVGTNVSMLGTYFNKDMFKEHNLEIPTNWDEFLNCCKVLKDAGIQPIVMGDKDMYVMQFGLYQIAASKVYAKNTKFDDQLSTGETKFTDKETWDEVISMYKTLYDEGYIDSSSLGLSAQQAIQKFVDGEAAMTFDHNGDKKALCANGAVDFERGYFPLPGNSADEELWASMSIGATPAIYSGSKHKEEAKAILEKWFDGESDIWKGMVDMGNIVVTYGYGSDQVDEFWKPFMDLYNEGKSSYWCNQGWPSGTENEMEALFSEAIGGQGTTVEDIVNGMQLKFEELYTAE